MTKKPIQKENSFGFKTREEFEEAVRKAVRGSNEMQKEAKECCHFAKIGHCWHCKNRGESGGHIQTLCPLWKKDLG